MEDHQMLYDFIGVIVYSAGLIGWLFIWHYIVGYELFKKLKLLYLTFIGALFVFLANIIFSFFSTIHTHNMELKLYPYVESNAKTVAMLSLSIAVFVVIRIRGNQLDEATPLIKLFLWLIFWAFLISVLGCLPLYWMPTGKYWLTSLRHVKSTMLFYSLFILGSGIIVFIYTTGYKRSTIKEIQNRSIKDMIE